MSPMPKVQKGKKNSLPEICKIHLQAHIHKQAVGNLIWNERKHPAHIFQQLCRNFSIETQKHTQGVFE